MKIKFEDIKPGMIVERFGLVTKTIPAGTEKFWGDHNAVAGFCIHDSWSGQAAGGMDDGEELNLICGVGTKTYADIIAKIRGELLDSIKARRSDIVELDQLVKS